MELCLTRSLGEALGRRDGALGGIRGDGICQEHRQASLIHNCWVSQWETNYSIEQATSSEIYPYNMFFKYQFGCRYTVEGCN